MNLLWERRELVANLVGRELKSRYKGSALGFLWTILNPLFMAIIYIFFMRLLAGRLVAAEEILIGVFAWQFTVQSVTGGMNCITGNSNLVKKVAFPRIILPVACLLANLISFLISLGVQLVLVGVMLGLKGLYFGPALLALPLWILYHSLFNLMLILLVSAANVYFRDTQHLVGLALSAWFFVSPVMYHFGLIEQMIGTGHPLLIGLYWMNPLTAIITGYRAAQIPDAVFPCSAFALAGLIWPVFALGAALLIYRKAQRNFADYL